MCKMKMELDYDKMEKEGYDIENIDNFLTTEFEKRNITKNEEGFYVGGTFEAFWGVILSLSKMDWFLDIIKEWVWFNSHGYDVNSDNVEIDDLKVFFINKKEVQTYE